MPDEVNRKGIARGLKLSERVGEKRLVRAVRRFARKLRDYGRPFVLPQSLDLEGCLDAVERRLEEERALQEEIGNQLCDELEAVRRKFDERERQVHMRILVLQLLLRTAYEPTRDPKSFGAGQGARLPGVRAVSDRRAAGRRSDDTPP